MKGKIICDNCKYFELEIFDDEEIGRHKKGLCRRYAPQPARLSTVQALHEDRSGWPMTRWAETGQYDWCGEFKKENWKD